MGAEGGGGGLGFLQNIFSGVAKYSAAQQQADAYQSFASMQAQAYEANARLAEIDAAAARDAAEANAAQQDKVNAAQLAAIRNSALSNGFALEGTPILLLEEEARQGELARLNEIYKGDVTATKYENEAKTQRFYGQQAIAAGEIKASGVTSRAGSSILGSLFGG